MYYGVLKDLDPEERAGLMVMDKERVPIVARLITARKLAGFSRPELADELGIHRVSVWRYENIRMRTIPRELLKSWAEVCGVPFGWLENGGPSGSTILDLHANRYGQFIRRLHGT